MRSRRHAQDHHRPVLFFWNGLFRAMSTKFPPQHFMYTYGKSNYKSKPIHAFIDIVGK